MIRIKKEKKKTSFRKLDFQQFEGKLVQKINLNADEVEYQEGNYQDKKSQIGCAWSGINQRMDDTPLSNFGTENGMLVRFSMNSEENIENGNNLALTNRKIEDKINGEDNELSLVSNHSHMIRRAKKNSQNSNHMLQIQVFKVFDDSKPCFQIGQIKDYTIISGKENDIFKLKIFDKGLNQIIELYNMVATFHFTRSVHNVLIFREVVSFDMPTSIVLSKIRGNALKILNKITFQNCDIFPTTIMSYEDFLFVGLFQQLVHVYSLKKRKLLRVINPQIDSYVKKIIFNKNILVIVSLQDQIVFLNAVSGKIIVTYLLKDIMKLAGFTFQEKQEIYLFTFISPDIVIIGGSFPYLLFFQWKTNQILRIYQDQSNFIGLALYNNFLYLSHEKSPFISILQ